jgi:cytochrome P450
MDFAKDLSVPLPMMVIAEMLGVPSDDHERFKLWTDAMLKMSQTVPGGPAVESVLNQFAAATAEMNAYLGRIIEAHQKEPSDNLLCRLRSATVDGEELTQSEILGFFQLLLLAGSETTTNLLNNAILSFIENPDQLQRLRREPKLLPNAIEEALRYRSPVQWMFRVAKKPVQMHGQTIPQGKLVLAMIGSANRDPKAFPEPHRFDIERDPNPHIAFGSGIHSCLGAALARLEARIALASFLNRTNDFRLAAEEPWEPNPGLHVHGPTHLPIRFTPTPLGR